MKALIWFGVLLIAAGINTAFAFNGITLGAIPIMLLYWLAFALGKALCKNYDEKKAKKEADKKGNDPQT